MVYLTDTSIMKVETRAVWEGLSLPSKYFQGIPLWVEGDSLNVIRLLLDETCSFACSTLISDAWRLLHSVSSSNASHI